MGESAFSEDGKYFSNISQDGRLRIWDTEANVLKQEYTPDLHLTSPPSCLKWISIGNSTGSQQKGTKRKSSGSEQQTQCIAIGTASGKILLYSVTQAKVDHVLKEEKPGSFNSFITSLDWHIKYGLYTCNKSNYVYYWDISNGNVKNKYNVIFDSKNKQGNSVGAIKIVPHSLNTPAIFLITASWQVCLWRLHNNETSIVRNLGHNTTQHAILALSTLNKTSWLVVGSQNERLLSFWDVTITDEQLPQVNGEPTSKKQMKLSNSSPTYNFVLEDAPRFVDMNVKDDEGTRLRIGATTRSGVLHYYDHALNGASVKPLKPAVTVQVTSPDAQPMPVQCCQLTGTGTDILLGYTHGPTTTFERITPDTKTKTHVLIRGESSKKSKRSSPNDVTKTPKTRQDTDGVNYVEPMGGQVVNRKRTVSGQIEVPMEARLENLALDPKSRSKSAVNQNLTKLLMQGLHSNDIQLINTVLFMNDAGIANSTVASLPVDCVPLLLEQLLYLATRKTSKCASACTWTKAVLRSHAALLLASSNSNNVAHSQLAQLLAIFTHRRSHLCQLLNLSGRLELTMSQRDKPGEHSQEAVLDYNDDSDMEVEIYQSDSEQSWDDEKDEGKGDEKQDDSDEE